MSESNSAVLDMTDEPNDSEGTVSAADGMCEAVRPLIMEHGYDIAVKVDSPLKQLSTLETFVTYRVRCVCARWPTPPHVRRRYNHFKALHGRLTAAHPHLAPPPLPPLHSARQQLDRYSRGFVALRALALDAFLSRVALHPILTHSEDFRIFLTTPDEDIDKVFRNENSALNLWGFSSALYGNGEAKPTNGARVRDPEFAAETDYLQTLHQKLTALCNVTNKLNKGTAALSEEYNKMSSVLSRWSGGEGGNVGRALSAAAGGAGGAAAARGAAAGGRSAALLPLLAAYAHAQLAAVRRRDALHAAYVAGSNNADDLHNRLEQASEALRSDLADWKVKTKADVKSILLELAERQVFIHQQNFVGWENALKMATETNVEQLFKTVSKNAVHNLSPSKPKQTFTPEPETEIDIDNLSNDYSDASRIDTKSMIDVDLNKIDSIVDLQGSRVVEEDSSVDRLQYESIKDVKSGEIIGEVSSEIIDEVSSDKIDNVSSEKIDVIMDPLQSFSDINLNEDT